MQILVFGKKGFLANRLRLFFNSNNVKAKFIGSKDIDLSKSSSASKIKKLSKKKYRIIFLSAITPDKGKDEKVFLKNIIMITNLFKFMKIEKIDHFLYISSDAVFNLGQNKISDKTTPAPSDLYGLMHYSRESICNLKMNKKKLTILRPTIIYGKGDTHNSYGPNRFINELKKNQTINIFGKGLDIRDHLYIDDLIKIISKSILKKIHGIFNIGSGKSYTFMNVIKKIKKYSKKNISVNYVKVNNKPTKRFFYTKTIKKIFKIKFTSLEVGIKKYLS